MPVCQCVSISVWQYFSMHEFQYTSMLECQCTRMSAFHYASVSMPPCQYVRMLMCRVASIFFCLRSFIMPYISGRSIQVIIGLVSVLNSTDYSLLSLQIHMLIISAICSLLLWFHKDDLIYFMQGHLLRLKIKYSDLKFLNLNLWMPGC